MGKYGRTRADMYIADRDKGMTYKQIAEKHGVSAQRIKQVCSRRDPRKFQVISDKCVYPNLRNWMNQNRVSRNELLRRMGEEANPNIAARLRDWMRGTYDPRKYMIDKMLKATGMTYEELFAREEDHE